MKYDAKMKKIITKDWAEEFPGFKVWKPTRLIRRCGPILVGVCLDSGSSSDVYVPVAHVHNLCEPFPAITLSLEGRVLDSKGFSTNVKVEKHTETYLQFIKKIKEEYPYIDRFSMDFNELILATQKYLTGRINPYQHGPYNDIVTIAAYLGQIDYAVEALNNFASIVSEWPDRACNIIGSVEKWKSGLLEFIENPHKLKQNVEQEIIKHKLAEIADEGLSWPEKPLKLWEMPCKPMFA